MTRTWVRLGLVAVAVPQLVTGIWATFARRSFYDDFPGLGASWVAADGPYNAHLVTDAGAGFLATAVGLLLAAAWGRRREVTLALVIYLVGAVPHLAYHVANAAPELSDAENAQSVAALAAGVVLPLVLLWGNRSTAPPGPAAPAAANPSPS